MSYGLPYIVSYPRMEDVSKYEGNLVVLIFQLDVLSIAIPHKMLVFTLTYSSFL